MNKKEIIKQIERFLKYKRRVGIIEEVKKDLYLVRSIKDFSFNFVVDFYQLFIITHPPISYFHVNFSKGKVIDVYISTFKEINERKKIFRDRLRKAIPFFSDIPFYNPPLLIPPYKEELLSSLNNEIEKLILKKTRNYLLDEQSEEIFELKEKWVKNLVELKNVFLECSIKEKEKFLSEFSNNIVSGFYFLSLAISSHKNLLNYLLSDKSPREHVIKMKQKKYNIIRKKIHTSKWLSKLTDIRPDKPFSNVVDSIAISTVLELNKESSKNKRHEIYFLLSDAEAIRKLLIENSKRDFLIKLPKQLLDKKLIIDNNINILRTSYHFEEFLLAFYKSNIKELSRLKNSESSIDSLIDYLDVRLNSLIRRTYNISPVFINRVKENCNKENECPCNYSSDCNKLKMQFIRFFEIEEEETNLYKIAYNDISFKYLLEFINRYFCKIVSENQFSILCDFEELYTNYFQKDNQKLKSHVGVILDKLKNESKKNILSIIQTSTLDKESPMILFTSIERIEGINYCTTFSKHKNLGKIFNKLKYLNLNKIKDSDLKSWHDEVFNILINKVHDAHETLLQIIIFYCYREYLRAWKLTKNFINKNFNLISRKDLVVEYYYMLYSSEVMIEFIKLLNGEGNYKNIEEIIEDIKDLLVAYNHDPRLLFLIAKIYENLFFFNIRRNIQILKSAVYFLELAEKEIEHLENIKRNNLKFLKIPIYNKILWCYSKLLLMDKLQEIEILEKYYEKIYPYAKKTNYCETIACYYYLHSKRYSRKENKKYFRKALFYLNASLLSWKKEGYRYYDLEIKSLNTQYDNWKKEYIKLYSIKNYNKVENLWKSIILKKYLDF